MMDNVALEWEHRLIHGVAAIANHCLLDSDPRKITQNDVTLCRSIAGRRPSDRAGDETSPELAAELVALNALAEKLAALLPPQQETM